MALTNDFKVKNGLTVTDSISAGGNLSASDGLFNGDVLASGSFGTHGWQGDSNTHMKGLGDRILFTVGGLTFADFSEGSQDLIHFNGNENQDIDFRVGYNGGASIFSRGSDGNVGIGTTSPSAPLDISSSATGGTTIELDNTSTGGRNWTLYSSGAGNSFGAGKFALYDADAASVRMLVDEAGKVGIGTTSPSEKLHISSATTATLAIQSGSNNAEGSKMRLTEGATYNGGFIHYDGSANALKLGVHAPFNSTLSDDTNVITIPRDTGNVGIGTTSPSQKLHVAGTIYSSNSGTDGGSIRLANTGGGSNWYWAARTTGLNLGELGAADNRIFIKNGGNVGIGTGSPTQKLDVAGNINTSGTITSTSTSTNTLAGKLRVNGTTTAGIEIASSSGATTGLKLFNNSSTDTASILNHYNGDLLIGTNNATVLTMNGTSSTFAGQVQTGTDLIVGGGDITLVGTGRIQGIDTVSSGTDAANKTYVDNCIAAIPSGGTVTNVLGCTGITVTNGTGNACVNVDAAQPTITSLGNLTSLTVDDITINSSTISDGGTLIIDAGADLVLDAGGGDICLKDDGTEFGRLQNSGSHFAIHSIVSDKDIIFKGNDGGASITALTLDMSDAGTATFNHNVNLPDGGQLNIGANADLYLTHDDNNGYFYNNKGDLFIDQTASDSDIIFKGTDGGSDITALRLDMSDGGSATFNNFVSICNSSLKLGGNPVTSTAAELNLLDGFSSIPGACCTGDVTTNTAQTITGTKNFCTDICVGNKIIHTSDSDTYFQFASNDVYVVAGNTVAIRANASETVINDNAASYDFRVEGDTDTHALFVDGSADKVGIGTSSPAHKLHIASGTTNVGIQTISTDAGAYMGFEDNSTGNTGSNSNVLVGANGNNFVAFTNAAERLRINSSGNVGIGTSSPSTKLQVAGTSQFDGNLNVANSTLSITAAAPNMLFVVPSGGLDSRIFNDGSGNFIIGHGTNSNTPTERLRINSSGNVGIGCTAPTQKLAVAGDGLFTSNLTVQGSLSVTGAFTCLDTTISVTSAMDITNHGTGPALLVNQTGSNDIVNFQDDGTSAFYIEDGGNVGINDTNPGHKLDVNGNINVTGDYKMDDSTIINTSYQFTGNGIDMGDNHCIKLGAGDDLVIKHDGSDSFINDQGTGDLYVQTNGNNMFLRDSSSGNTFIAMNTGTANVDLKHGGNTKLQTTSAGINVCGTGTFTSTVNATQLCLAGSADTMIDLNQTGTDTGWSYINFKTLGTRNYYVGQDNSKNFQIYNDNIDVTAISVGFTNANVTLGADLTVSGGDITLGGTGRIQGIDTVSSGTDAANKTYADTKLALAGGTMSGDIAMGNNCITGVNNIQANGDLSLLTCTGEYAVFGSANAQTQLYYNGIKKFETTNVGIEVTGGINASGTLDISSTYPRINLNDTNHEDDWSIINADGAFTVYNVDDNVNAIHISTVNNVTLGADLTVCGGDITLGGTGRIQGVDTVSSGTDAANKTYVDNAVAGCGSGDGTVTSVTAGTGMTQSGTSTVNPTLNVIGGTGITANANDVAIDTSVVMNLASAQTVTGTKNFCNTICVGDKIVHTGDSNTCISFTDDLVKLTAGGVEMIRLTEGGADNVHINPGSCDVNLQVSTACNSSSLFVDGGTGQVGIGTSSPSATLAVNGSFTATCKSFLVDNPVTGGQLKYGVVEGNEHGVTVRGSTCCGTIDLPAEWDWLVEEDSVTAQITPVGSLHTPYVVSQDNKQVVVCSSGCYNYNIYGTRKDVEPLEVNIL